MTFKCILLLYFEYVRIVITIDNGFIAWDKMNAEKKKETVVGKVPKFAAQ